jgi:hypothetical protein
LLNLSVAVAPVPAHVPAPAGGEKSGKRLHLIGFCPNGDRNASDDSGKNTAYAIVRDHIAKIVKNHAPGIDIQSSNCREVCEKQEGNTRYCKHLSPEEIDS